MQVYIELAMLENFCMDFTLLYCAKLISKNAASIKRTAVAASFGACFAVVFPLVGAGPYLAVFLKLASGLIIALIACKLTTFKGFLKFAGAFAALSAALAGVLYGIFSLAGVAYFEGAGYILSSVPVGIPLFCALVMLLAVRALKNKFFKGGKKQVDCRIFSAKGGVNLKGFFDSGNKVYFRGAPVTVIPPSAAEKLVDVAGIKDGVKIHTVAGSKILKVFTADRLEIDSDGKTRIYKDVKLGISAARLTCAVLHPDFLEE